MYPTASYWTTISFNVRSHAPVASVTTTTALVDPSVVCVPDGHVTVRESVTAGDQLAETRIAPAPVNGREAVGSSGCCRSPVQLCAGAEGWTGAAASDPVVVGVTVVGVVVVVGAVAEARVVVAAVTGPRTSGLVFPFVADDPPAAAAVGVPAGDAGTRVVVVVGEGSRECAVGAAGLPWPSGVAPATRRWPRGLGWSEATAATNARSESATASTAHQCGRIRAGSETDGPDVLISPPTG